MTSPTYKILFVCSSLGGGGAERALVNIINNLNRSKFQSYLALFQKRGEFLFEIMPDVQPNELQTEDYGFIRRNIHRIQGLIQLINNLEPVLIVSINWQVNLVTIFAKWLSKSKAPIVIIEQIAPRESTHVDYKRGLFRPIEKYLYPKADFIVTASRGISEELANEYRIPRSKIQTIHNPIAIEEIKLKASENIRFKSSALPVLISVGRLVKQKNYPLLLESTFELIKTNPIELYILGQGPEESVIKDLADNLGISNNVHLLGFTKNPYAYLIQADIFALTSNFEGFGNVIVEAMACGIPVVATDCPYGPREILDNGEFGLIIPVGDKTALVNALRYLLEHPEKREYFIERGKIRCLDFSPGKIVQEYEALFFDLIQNLSTR